MRSRAAKTAAVMASGQAVAPVAAKKRSLIQMILETPKFFREVRAESRKITWTTRKETWITSVMVAIMVVLASIFFLGVDWIINFALSLFLKFANAG